MAGGCVRRSFIASSKELRETTDEEMADLNLNNTVMPGLLNAVSNRVVAILVETTEPLVFSGTVLVSRPNFIYVVTVSRIIDHIDKATIKVKTPNNSFITLERDKFYMDEESGIVVIRVDSPTPGEDYGFEDLVEVAFKEHGIQDQQLVYTYNIEVIDGRPDVRMLSPGSIILIEDEAESFDHNSAMYKCTHLGAPVVNKDGNFVGICYHYSGEEAAGYLSAYNARLIADEIERRQI